MSGAAGRNSGRSRSGEVQQMLADSSAMESIAATAINPVKNDADARKWISNARNAGINFDSSWIRQLSETSLGFICNRYQATKAKLSADDKKMHSLCEACRVLFDLSMNID